VPSLYCWPQTTRFRKKSIVHVPFAIPRLSIKETCKTVSVLGIVGKYCRALGKQEPSGRAASGLHIQLPFRLNLACDRLQLEATSMLRCNLTLGFALPSGRARMTVAPPPPRDGLFRFCPAKSVMKERRCSGACAGVPKYSGRFL
jgi:hypothetical protein